MERTASWLREVIAAAAARPGEETEPGACGSSHAVLALERLGELAAAPPALLCSLARLLQEHQDPRTGVFVERAWNAPRSIPDVTPEALRLTWVAVNALDALGRRPAHRLRFLDDEAADRMTGAVESLNLSDRTSCSAVATLLGLLIHRAEAEQDAAAVPRLHRLLDRLDSVRDPRTGLWGPPEATLGDRLEATGRLLPFFDYVHRPVARRTALAEASLAVVTPEIGVAGLGGDAAREQAILALLGFLLGDDYAAERIRASMLRAGRTLSPHAPENENAAARAETVWLKVASLGTVRDACGPDDGGPPAGARRWPMPGYRPRGRTLTAHERAVLPLWARPLELCESAEPDVAVVMPCLDLGRSLHDALASIAAQSTARWELVVVDDGSTDEATRLLLGRLAAGTVRVIRQENAGVAVARNRGIRETRARYVCCLDPDDRIAPAFLERAAAALDARPEAGFVIGRTRSFEEQEAALPQPASRTRPVPAHDPVGGPAVFRRAAWEAVGGYRGGLPSPGIEDWDFWLRLIEAGFACVALPDVITEYRMPTETIPARMTAGRQQGKRWWQERSASRERRARSRRD